jgi:hypothetical protein
MLNDDDFIEFYLHTDDFMLSLCIFLWPMLLGAAGKNLLRTNCKFFLTLVLHIKWIKSVEGSLLFLTVDTPSIQNVNLNS